MIVVSDTSVITNLIQVGQIKILNSLFQTIIIPNFVFEELCRLANQKEIIGKLNWIKVKEVKDREG